MLLLYIVDNSIVENCISLNDNYYSRAAHYIRQNAFRWNIPARQVATHGLRFKDRAPRCVAIQRFVEGTEGTVDDERRVIVVAHLVTVEGNRFI